MKKRRRRRGTHRDMGTAQWAPCGHQVGATVLIFFPRAPFLADALFAGGSRFARGRTPPPPRPPPPPPPPPPLPPLAPLPRSCSWSLTGLRLKSVCITDTLFFLFSIETLTSSSSLTMPGTALPAAPFPLEPATCCRCRKW